MIRDRAGIERDRRDLASGVERIRSRAPAFYGMGLWARGASTPVFDPATLALTGWWRASYSGSPWVGTASAGASGSRDLTEATNPPAVGAAVNGLTPADFDGTNDRLSNATAMSSFLTTTDFSGWALIDVDAISSNNAAPAASTNNVCVFCTLGTGQLGLYLRSGGGTAGAPLVGLHILGASVDRTVTADFATGSPQLVRFKQSGGSIAVAVNGGAWSTATGGTINSLAAALDVGRNPSQTLWLNGRIIDVALSQAVISDGDYTSIRTGYINSRYALSL